MAPIRNFLRPFTTRQTARNQSRSVRKSSESGASVCSVVSENGIPYCARLLQADIFPQKLSRRSRMDMCEGVSGVACIRMGTPRFAILRVSAMARSSPKFGSVTTIPSSCSRCFLKTSAQRAASWRVSTAPNLDSLSSRITGRMPLAVRAAIMSCRPERARWSGKKPRFPTMTPSVAGVLEDWVMAPLRDLG